MRNVPAPIYPLIAVLSWGAMFPLAAIALPHVDPFNITAIRYGVASVIFVIILATAEGRGAFSLEGQGWRLFALGSLGFAGFNLLACLALIWSQPQDVAVIVPTMPLVTVLVRWVRGGGRPSPMILSASIAALFGVFLVVTKGDVTRLSGGLGDALTFVAVVCWVIYTMSAAKFPSWSALRYTGLTAPLGTITILAVTAVADAFGWQRLPAPADVAAAWWELAFIVLFGAVAAVLAWNHGARLLGAANTALFIVLVPVVTLAMRIAGGYQPAPAEVAGIAVVVGALVVANLSGRRTASRPVPAPAAD
ncbi:DMT family transporter [Sinomonas sp. ASV322]|uniref:DMT family transporter n=1 Tax=Sinomonas sp. ASV322 TaxID=3041920 RepID=UPI0027DADE7A|nr:DMT family transporter [Sinomonas sp. ASV322]MDQ4503055.1 DMT family transporter [Sinomonas sp. ASV322]